MKVLQIVLNVYAPARLVPELFKARSFWMLLSIKTNVRLEVCLDKAQASDDSNVLVRYQIDTESRSSQRHCRGD